MDDKTKDLLSDTKKIVKSLIIPYQTGVKMRQLCDDYKEIEGKELPYRQLGYNTLTDFLKAIPDVLRMYGTVYDPHNVIIFPVADDNTRHIVELVGCQKKDPKRAKPVSQRMAPRQRLNLNPQSYFIKSTSNMFNNYRSNNVYRSSKVVDYSHSTNRHHSVPQSNQPLLNTQFFGHLIYPNNVLERAINNLNLLHLNITEGLSRLSMEELNVSEAISILNGVTNCVHNAHSHHSNLIKREAINVLKSQYLSISRAQNLLDYQHFIVDEALNILNSQYLASNLLQTHSTSRQQTQSSTASNANVVKSPNFKYQNFTVSRNVDNNERTQTSGGNISLNESKPTAQPLSGNEVLQISQSPFLPPDMKSRVEKMMCSPEMDDGVMLYNFEAQYRHCYKEAFEWKKVGFNSLADCLKSLPHIVNLIPAGTTTYKIIPIKKESNVQQTTSCDNTDSLTNRNVVGNTESIAIITTTATTTIVTVITTSSVMNSTPTITTTTVSHMNGSVSASPINSPQNNSDQQSELEAEDEEMSSADNSRHSPISHLPISSMAVSNFRRILSRHKDGIPACLFGKEYQKDFGVSFDCDIWGYISPMEMFYSLSAIFAVQPPTASNEVLFPGYGDEYFLHDARYKKFDIVNESEKQKDRVDLSSIQNIPDSVTAQILKLIESTMPSGLALPYFTDEYRMNYGSLSLASYRIANTRQLFDLLKHILPIDVRPVDGTDRAFLKSAAEVESFVCACNRQYRFQFAKTIVTNIPNGVVLPGEQLRDMTLPSDITIGKNEYSAVLISSAKDPSNIWVQFKGEDYHSALEQMMSELDFYEKIDLNEWRVPKQFICVNYPVISRFPGDHNWHRARIMRLHPHNSVTISFVDYGGIITTSTSNLYLMKREFLSLETQALRVGLYGIKPYLGAHGWTTSARDCLLDNFSKPNYFIACTFMEKIHDRYYLVCMCDTNDPNNDVFVHDILCEQNHAIYDVEVCADTDNDNDNDVNDDNKNNQNNSTINIGLESNSNLLGNNNSKRNEISEHELLKTITNKLKNLKSFDVKWIDWKRSKVAILLQKNNGPCSVIALFNYLSLCGLINLPNDSKEVSAPKLFKLLADFTIITTKTLSKLVNTDMKTFTYNIISKFFGGLNVNVNFGDVKLFDVTEEIKLFALLDIPLMHGWLIDPNEKALYALFGCYYYNELTDYIVSSKISKDDRVISNGLMAEQFINSSQLTEFGLQMLYHSLNNDELSIFFRNNHFVVLYKNADTLYQLLSDCLLINSCDAVWETLTNINGDEVFVNQNFVSVSNQNQLDYEVALKLDKQLNSTQNQWNDWNKTENNNNNDVWNNTVTNNNNEWNKTKTYNTSNWETNEENTNNLDKTQDSNNNNIVWNKVEPNDDNWDVEWNKFKITQFCAENQPQIHSTINITDNSVVVNEQNPRSDSAVIPLATDKHSLETDIKCEANSSELLEDSNKHLLGSTDDLSTLPPPLVPVLMSTQSVINESGDGINEDVVKVKEEVELSDTVKINMSELVSAAQKVISESNTPNLNARKHISPNRKLAPSITITRNVDTGERHILNNNANNAKLYENGVTIGIKNLERMRNLDLTPTNSDTDDTETGDMLIHKVSNDIDVESINKAKVRGVLINQIYCFLIRYKDKYYFTFNAVNEIFKDLELWQTVRKSGGYLKGRIQLATEEGLQLFTQLNIKNQLIKSDIAILYPHESVLRLAHISNMVAVKTKIKIEVSKFHNDLLEAEKTKLMARINQIDQKIKKGVNV